MTDNTEIEAPSLGIQDIENALKIIDFAADQGTFKGWTTIEQVRTVRDKIALFVTFARDSEAAEAANTPADAETPANEPAATAKAQPAALAV